MKKTRNRNQHEGDDGQLGGTSQREPHELAPPL